jgi:hypothetical protein
MLLDRPYAVLFCMLRVFLYSYKLARSKIEMILKYIVLLIKDMAHSGPEFVKDSV